MKANDAPEKLYFGESDKGLLDIYSTKESNDEVEYTRTDAFIEKACEWLEENVERHISADGEYTVYYEEMFEEFIKAMKGGEV